MDMNAATKIALAFVIAVTAITAGAISLVITNNQKDVSGGPFSNFSNYDELTSYLKSSRGGNNFYGNWTEYSTSVPMADGSKSETSFSRTNVQVQGVDEDDTVKTDGHYIYISSGDRVSIVEAYPPENLRNVSEILPDDFVDTQSENVTVWISGLFLSTNKLIVIASVHNMYPMPMRDVAIMDAQPISIEPRTSIYVFDVTDILNPTLQYSVGVSGYAITARVIGNFVYLINQAYIWESSDQVLVPEVWSGGEATDVDIGKVMYDPGTMYPSAFVNILAVNIASGAFDYKSIIAGYASTVYMSEESLYVTFQKWSGVVAFEDGTLAPEDDSGTQTTICKLSINGLVMEPVAKGEVKGWLLNQFSMDEKDGYLRVATTTGWAESRNSVFVLSSNLTKVGELNDLAPTERIYAARFINDTLYLVTFRQTDPLFVIDLSNPVEPKVVGELVVPGFSSYLHPVDDTHILGIGQENSTVKISLFNVSDPGNPVEQSKYVLDTWSYSFAGWDHKAVLFDLSKQLLVIPVESWGTYNDTYGMKYTSGAYVFTVSLQDGISLKGLIQHDMPSYYGSGWVQRSLYIGDFLYTVSYCLVKVNSISDLSEVGSLVYNVPYWANPVYGNGGVTIVP